MTIQGRLQRSLLVLGLALWVPLSWSDAGLEPASGWRSSLDWLVEQRNTWSSGVETMASSIDGFLAGEEAELQATNSYVRLRVTAYRFEGDGWSDDTEIKVKLDLPATRKRWKLFFENRVDELESLVSSNRATATDEDTSFIGGAGKEEETHGWRFRREAGVKFRLPLEPFVRLRADKEVQLNDQWSSRFRQSVYWFDDDGLGAKTQLFFERPWGKAFFRAKSEAKWSDEISLWEWAQVFTRQRQLDGQSASAINVGLLGNGQHDRVESYFANLHYRKQLYKDWLFAEVVPEVVWSRNDDFEPRWSFTARLEVIFAE